MQTLQEKEVDIVYKPSYYVRKRFFRNISAVIGLGFVLFAVIIAFLGYLIMPDNTPNADDGNPHIQIKPPGFSAKILKKHKNIPIHTPTFVEKLITGVPSEYTIIPIENYKIDKNTLIISYKVFGGIKEEKISLVAATKSLYVGDLKDLKGVEKMKDSPYLIDGDKVLYINYEGQIEISSKESLIAEFEKNNIEDRTYWLGTDKQGRDMLSRLIFGTRISLSIGLVAVLISVLVGVSLGSLAGFLGGKIDYTITWFMTVVWSIPQIMLVIAISLALGRGIWVAFIAVGLTTWVDIARLVRGEIMAIKEKQFVEASKALGLGNFRIVTRHILPNLFGPLIVVISSNFASAILTEAGLSFLGLGAQPPMPSWGMMVYEGKNYIGSTNGFHMIFYPSLAISIMVLAFNLLGNGLRDAYDPKTLVK
ncbi:MAG: ABC transporter permease [Raineya sp.]|jgi:peptide/nickel transport system permease protein|nr:ABC transporter permease [Raineya sp.]